MFVEKGVTILTLVGIGLFYWQEISNLLVKIKMRMISMNRHDDIDEAKENLYYSSLGLNQGIRKLKNSFGSGWEFIYLLLLLYFYINTNGGRGCDYTNHACIFKGNIDLRCC